jgi:hypothetical protein
MALDAVLILGSAWAVAWAATNGWFVAQRAYTNRTLVQVHLANGPLSLHALNNAPIKPKVRYQGIRHGDRTVRVTVYIENEGPDGLVLSSATVSGPFLSSSTVLEHGGTGYVAVRGTSPLTGTVTVDCDAAAGVANSLVAMTPAVQQAPTVVTATVHDTDGAVRQVAMTLDTTAAALQGQVCVS